MSDSADFFKRQSGQMKAVMAETMEVLEATKEVIARLQTVPPPALSASLPLPPPPAQVLPPLRRIDTGRYSVYNPPASVPPDPPRLAVVPRPAAAPKPAVEAPPANSEVRAVVPRPSQVQARPALRPAPPRKAAASDTDDR